MRNTAKRRRGSSSVRQKQYDREYFQRWYHDSGTRILLRDALSRKVTLAVAAAEFVLGRRLRSVLDVGCGEASWRAPLRRLRPRVRYVGVDGSSYAARRFGKTRGIRHGRFGALGAMRLGGPFDLVVCADVLHYVPERELGPGVRALSKLTNGLAWIEIFTSRDASIGDHVEYHARPPSHYQRLFNAAGLESIGLYSFVPRHVDAELTEYERGVRSGRRA